VYPTARALGINYGALKAHVERAAPAAERPTFVELAPVRARQASECVIELETPRGTTRIRMSGIAVADVVALARALGESEA
jgi:hypothetical protein